MQHFPWQYFHWLQIGPQNFVDYSTLEWFPAWTCTTNQIKLKFPAVIIVRNQSNLSEAWQQPHNFSDLGTCAEELGKMLSLVTVETETTDHRIDQGRNKNLRQVFFNGDIHFIKDNIPGIQKLFS